MGKRNRGLGGPTTAKHLSFGGRLSPDDCIGVMSDKTFAGASGGRLALWFKSLRLKLGKRSDVSSVASLSLESTGETCRYRFVTCAGDVTV